VHLFIFLITRKVSNTCSNKSYLQEHLNEPITFHLTLNTGEHQRNPLLQIPFQQFICS